MHRRGFCVALLLMSVAFCATGSPLEDEDADETHAALRKKLSQASHFGLTKTTVNGTAILPALNKTHSDEDNVADMDQQVPVADEDSVPAPPKNDEDGKVVKAADEDSNNGPRVDEKVSTVMGRPIRVKTVTEEKPPVSVIDVNTIVFTLNPLPAGTTLSVDAGVSAVIVVPKGLIPGIDPDMPFVLRVYRTTPILSLRDEKLIRRALPIPLPSVLIPILPGTAQIVVFPDGTVKQNTEFSGTPVRVDGAVVGV